jgi:hypothetical protein
MTRRRGDPSVSAEPSSSSVTVSASDRAAPEADRSTTRVWRTPPWKSKAALEVLESPPLAFRYPMLGSTHIHMDMTNVLEEFSSTPMLLLDDWMREIQDVRAHRHRSPSHIVIPHLLVIRHSAHRDPSCSLLIKRIV